MKKRKANYLKGSIKPGFLKKVEKLDRRSFIRLSAFFGVGSTLALSACLLEDRAEISAKRDPNLLSEKEWNTLIAVQAHLFPHEKNAPGAHDVNAAGFFQWVLSDPLLDPNEIAFKKNGLSWLNEESDELFQKEYSSLKEKEKEKTLRSMVEHSWGRSWVSVMLLHIFEALLSDPIYGGNTDMKGWEWLNYTSGIPKPENGKIYLDYKLVDGTFVSSRKIND